MEWCRFWRCHLCKNCGVESTRRVDDRISGSWGRLGGATAVKLRHASRHRRGIWNATRSYYLEILRDEARDNRGGCHVLAAIQGWIAGIPPPARQENFARASPLKMFPENVKMKDLRQSREECRAMYGHSCEEGRFNPKFGVWGDIWMLSFLRWSENCIRIKVGFLVI